MTTQKNTSAPKKGGRSKTSSARRRARELTLQGLYQWRIANNDEAAIEAYIADLDEYKKADSALFLGLLRGILARHEQLEAKLQAHLDRPFMDLSPIEACILLIGTFELSEHLETPYRVIINEAIELTKAFGGTDGHKYVNGVLDKVAAEERATEINARAKSQAN